MNKKERMIDAMMMVLSAVLVRDPQGMEEMADPCRRLLCEVRIDEVEDGPEPGQGTFRDEEGEDEVAKGCFVPNDERDEQGGREDDRRDVDTRGCVVELVVPSHGREQKTGSGFKRNL